MQEFSKAATEHIKLHIDTVAHLHLHQIYNLIKNLFVKAFKLNEFKFYSCWVNRRKALLFSGRKFRNRVDTNDHLVALK